MGWWSSNFGNPAPLARLEITHTVQKWTDFPKKLPDVMNGKNHIYIHRGPQISVHLNPKPRAFREIGLENIFLFFLLQFRPFFHTVLLLMAKLKAFLLILMHKWIQHSWKCGSSHKKFENWSRIDRFRCNIVCFFA